MLKSQVDHHTCTVTIFYIALKAKLNCFAVDTQY